MKKLEEIVLITSLVVSVFSLVVAIKTNYYLKSLKIYGQLPTWKEIVLESASITGVLFIIAVLIILFIYKVKGYR